MFVSKGGNNIKIFNFINPKYKDKVILSLNRVQIDLLLKSLYIAQCNIRGVDPSLNLLLEDKENDFYIIFYLQRIIGATANKQIYNITDTSHFVKDREKYFINDKKSIDKKEII